MLGDVEVQVIEMTIFDQPEIIIDPGDCEEINCFGDVAILEPEYRWGNGATIFL